MKMKAMRSGGSMRFSAADTGAPCAIDSSHGSAITAPAPRNNVLRVIGFDILVSYATYQPLLITQRMGRRLLRQRGRRRIHHHASLCISERDAEHDLAPQS